MPHHSSTTAHTSSPLFAGFLLPTSNTTYTPNQFFDVCLPHRSRGCVRLVAYMIRKTLGWCDQNGQPQAEQHEITFSEFEREAGISRDMIKPAIEEAIKYHFITRPQLGAPNLAGQGYKTGCYELFWSEHAPYTKDPFLFFGFFAGEGNRTYIPNQFFDVVIPNETQAVIKVVGSVIRFSIGFQNKYGHRRQIASLSYQDIQNYSRIRNRGTLSNAIETALEHNYIQRVEAGYFDKNAGQLSRAATYALKWLNHNADQINGQKNVPGKSRAENQSEIRTGNDQKSVPDGQSEKRTDIQIKQINKTLKQQADTVAFERLRKEGFDAKAAEAITSKYPTERIVRQIEWLQHRKIRRNRLGLLRSAIEQDWSLPGAGSKPAANLPRESGASFERAMEQARSRLFSGSSTSSS